LLIFTTVSLLISSLWFAILYGLGLIVTYSLNWPGYVPVIFTVFIGLLQYGLSPWLMDRFFRIQRADLENLNPQLNKFIFSVCRDRNIHIPRFFLFEDTKPNVFTYGHFSGDARLVFTTGLLEMLEIDELKAVTAHELGHLYHRDFIAMTFFSVIPGLLYLWGQSLLDWGFSHYYRSSGGAAVFLGSIALAIYNLSNYLFFFLSRGREYSADRFSVGILKDSAPLLSALENIAFGLAKIPPEPKPGIPRLFLSMRSLGIFDPQNASDLAFNSLSGGGFSLKNMIHAIGLEKYNPWAGFNQWFSSHPMAAKRIKNISAQVKDAGERISQREFWNDLLVIYLPLIGLLIGLVIMLIWHGYFGIPILLLCLGTLLKLVLYYPGGNFKSLETCGSAENNCRIQIKGKITGSGIPGVFWYKYLVLQSEDRFIPVVLKQAPILSLFGGMLGGRELIDSEVIIILGWRRRAVNDFVEIQQWEVEGGNAVVSRYSPATWFLAIGGMVFGLLLLLLEFYKYK